MKLLEEIKNRKIKQKENYEKNVEILDWLLLFSTILLFLSMLTYSKVSGYFLFPTEYVGLSPFFALLFIISFFIILKHCSKK